MFEKLTGEELRQTLMAIIPDFDDPKLFDSTEIFWVQIDSEQIRKQVANGYISLDGKDGLQCYYARIQIV